MTIPGDKQDHRLPAKLRAELPGILAWAVEGCLEWQRAGLGTPQEVLTATEAYRAEMDVLADFLADMCLLAPSAEVTKAAIFDAYQKWCETNRERPLGLINFGKRLKERGIADHKLGREKVRGWLGVGLLAIEGAESGPEEPDSRTTRTTADRNSNIALRESSTYSVIPEFLPQLSALSARDEDSDDYEEGEL